MQNKLVLFTGNSNHLLASQISRELKTPIAKAEISRFSDGEVSVEIIDNVRGKDVFIIQSTSPPNTNDNLMELVVMADALRRASAWRITAVIPYFGYARQDRRPRSTRVPISAKVVADMLAAVGINRILTLDLHADQIQGFFDIPVDNVYANPVLLTDIEKQVSLHEVIIVSPDIGGVVRARAVAKRLHSDIDLAIIDKRRPASNQAVVMNIIGDVKDKTCIIIDDIVDTGGTLAKAAIALKEHGAKKVYAYSTHPVLSGNAINNINNSQIDELVVTNSIQLSDSAINCSKIRQLSIASLLADCIQRVSNEESISALFT